MRGYRVAGGVFFILFFILANIANAQTSGAEVNGTVTDHSGAAVAAATVTLTDNGTRIAAQNSTNENGYFVFVNVRPGKYALSVGKTGFKKAEVPELEIGVGQTVSQTLVLEVGSNNESVTVTAEGALIQSSSAELGTVIAEKPVHELPLNGRNFTQLLTLTPGATPISTAQGTAVSTQDAGITGIPGSSFSKPSVNGQQNRSTVYYMDGFLNTDFRVTVYGVLPIIDLIQEFKVESHNEKAEYGAATGGIVNVESKSGTNSFHGSGWEFVRNNFFDARDPFADAGSSGPAPFHQNEFGGTLGGPIIKNRLFFYGGYEGWRYSKPNQQLVLVPTAAELGGDFTNSYLGQDIYNPYSGNTARFTCDAAGNPIAPNANGTQTGGTPCNKIPTQLISPAMQTFLQGYLLSPNFSSGDLSHNFINNSPATDRADTWQVRVDDRLTSKDNLYFRITQMWVNDQQVTAGTNESAPSLYHVFNYGGGWNHTFRPNLIASVYGGVMTKPYNFNSAKSSAGIAPAQAAGFTDLDRFGGLTATLSGSNYLKIGDGNSAVGNSGDSIRNNPVWNLDGSINWIRGNHNFKFGVQYIYDERLQINTAQTFGFSSAITSGINTPGGTTGNALASALLGLPQNFSGSLPELSEVNLRLSNWAFYGQDEWRLRPNLTVTLGLRYDLLTQPRAIGDRISNALDLPNGNWLIGATSIGACGANPTNPCIPGGIASVPFNDHIVFKGQKSFMPKPVYDNIGPRLGAAWQINSKTVVRGAFTVYYDALSARSQYSQNDVEGAGWPWTTGFNGAANTPGGPLTPITSIEGNFPNPTPAPSPWVTTGNVWLDDPKFKDAYSEQWNVEVQRELSPNLVISAAYVGSRNERLPYTGYAAAAKKASPNSTCANGDDACTAAYLAGIDQLKPIPWLDPNLHYSQSTGYGNYNALQVKLQKRFTDGFQALVSYTWSKSMDNSSGWFSVEDGAGGGEAVQNFYDPGSNYSVSGYDITHYFTVSSVYELPFGRGRRWLNSGIGSWVLGNWQMNSVFTARSGQPFNLEVPGDPANIGGSFADVPGYPNYARPNRIGDPDSGTCSNGSRVGTSGCWYNPDAFSVPGGQYGNAGRNILRSDHVVNMDMSVFKNFPFREHYNLQLRFEAFNVFNIQALGVPNATIGSPSAGVISTSANPPRQMQFGLKFLF
jgi:hypothetical protein